MASGAQSSDTVEVIKPLNNFWIETLRLDIPYDIVRSDVDVVFQSDIYYLPLQNEDLFCFHVVKISTSEIKIKCLRGAAYYPDVEGDTGYILRFYFSVIGLYEPPRHADMSTDQTEISVNFETEYFRKKFEDVGYGFYVWQLKVVVRMLEYENLPNDHVRKADYDDFFESFKNKYVNTKEKKADMMTLLSRKSLRDIFSGRQNSFFVLIKMTYIQRALKYSTGIIEYIRKKRAMMNGEKIEVPWAINVPVVLNFICTGNETPITVEDLLDLFLRAYRFGMNFLKLMCTLYMVDELVNNDHVIDILKVADMVDDPILLRESMDVFMSSLSELLRSPKWKAFEDESNSAARSVIHALTFRAKYQELKVPTRVFDYMQESGTA